MESSFFYKMLQLPLFQGMTVQTAMQIAEKVRFLFHRIGTGASIMQQDDKCDSLIFVLEGEYSMEHVSNDHSYKIKEWFHKSTVLQPEALFGLTTRYMRSCRAESLVQLMEVEKSSVRDILLEYPTLRLNYMNMICWHQQRLERLLWKNSSDNLLDRIIMFVQKRSVRPAGKKKIYIKMERLADEVRATRLNVSKSLHALEDKGLLEIGRGHLLFPQFEKLLMHFS